MTTVQGEEGTDGYNQRIGKIGMNFKKPPWEFVKMPKEDSPAVIKANDTQSTSRSISVAPLIKQKHGPN